jgi:hypothetical protein
VLSDAATQFTGCLDNGQERNAMPRSLAASSIECAKLLDKLSTLLHDTQCQSRSALGQAVVEDQSARFRVWAGNLGAFQKLPAASSLDYRLREAPKIATQIQELLEDLRGDTNQSTASRCLPYAMLTDAVCAIASGNSPNRRHESEDERDEN